MKKIILFILLTVSTNVFSAYYTGENLITDIRSSSSIDRMVAMGYIYGVVDVYFTSCQIIFAGVSGNQLVQITKNYLEKHPENWNYTGESEVYLAISEKYPCKK